MKKILFYLTIAVILFSLTGIAGEIEKILNPASGNVIYVSIKSGNNKNPGSIDKPMKNIDKAIKKAKDGDTIAVAEGVYMGTFNIGYFECDKAIKFYGGFSSDFKKRDFIKYPTLLQPDNASSKKANKPLLKFTKKIDGTVIDGFVFDMGMRNSYSPNEGKPEGVETGMLLLPPKKAPGQNATAVESCISIPSAAPAGDVMITNNTFTNCTNFAIQGGIRAGQYKINNNVFVANRMGAVEIYGTCAAKGGPKAQTKCGEVEIANNTILFSWSRTKDFQDMGYGVRIMTRAGYDIHDNIIGANIMSGASHVRFNKDEWIKMDRNIFFVNKQADLEYSPESNTHLNLSSNEFDDLEFASVTENKNFIPKTLPIDKAYLQGFLSARYTETTDYNPDSEINQVREIFGLNKQGKMSSKATMYANRYNWQNAVKLFGAVANTGAQK